MNIRDYIRERALEYSDATAMHQLCSKKSNGNFQARISRLCKPTTGGAKLFRSAYRLHENQLLSAKMFLKQRANEGF